MKLTKLANTGLSQEKAVAGLLACRIDYELKSGKGQIDYTGPKFDPEMWYQVLSFFRWTHKEMDSESQVRLYVNTKLGRWGAWAFPQEAKTGMSAREIATPETPEQAIERFASWGSEPSGDWLYFATVHHHCGASAFQSGTDEANERNQDGLHITVGRLDAERHELHARFYLNGNCFAPDLSRFWPVDPALAEQVPATMHDDLARFQMGEKVVVDFPDPWRKHVIEVPAHGHQADGRQLGIYQWDDDYLGQQPQRSGRPDPSQLDLPVWIRTEHAFRDLTRRSAASSVPEEDVQVALQSLAGNPVVNLILEACLKHQVLPDEILGELDQYELGYESGF
jgi:hypothetical protein